jgi:hypothetical protein
MLYKLINTCDGNWRCLYHEDDEDNDVDLNDDANDDA